MSSGKKEASFMNGVSELLILRLLSCREMYGYELVAAIRQASGDVIQLSEGGVYPLLHSMEHQQLLKSRRMQKGGRSRLYYRLTPKGKQRLERTEDQWVRLSSAINAVLGSANAKPA